MLLLLSLVAYVALLAPRMERPLIYDDANFAFAAKAVAETGLPFGNQGWMSERGDFSQREQWALWHPPLGVYVFGLAWKVGGGSLAVLRVPGVLSGLVTGGLLCALAGELTRGSRGEKRLAGGVAAMLALLSPLAVQSALILDIDFVLLLPLTLLFLLAYLRGAGTRHWPWLAPLFAVLLWAKMTNPLAVLACIAAWRALRGEWRRVAQAMGIGLGGALLFGVTWVAVGTALGFPLDMPFGVNQVEWAFSAEVARRAYANVDAFFDGLRATVIWIGPGLAALGLLAGGLRAGQLVRRWRPGAVDLVLGLTMALAVGYVNKYAGWFPKYQVALVPLLALAAGPLVARLGGRVPGLSLLVAGGAAVVAWVAVLALVGDGWALERTWRLDGAAGAWLLGVVLAGGAVGAAGQVATDWLSRSWFDRLTTNGNPAGVRTMNGTEGRTMNGSKGCAMNGAGGLATNGTEDGRTTDGIKAGLRGGDSSRGGLMVNGTDGKHSPLGRYRAVDAAPPNALGRGEPSRGGVERRRGGWSTAYPAVTGMVMALVGVALGWSVGVDVVQARAAYSTTYWYGTSGIVEAAAWVDAHVPPGVLWVGAKEVAIRAGNQRYVDQENVTYFLESGRGFDGTWAGERVAAVVAWERDPSVAALLGSRLPGLGFVETARFGDYVVYEPGETSLSLGSRS